MSKTYFTSESVTEGHPDKIADQISDAILDAIIEKDPNARVACECLVTTGLVFIAGEITTECYVDLERIARETIRDIGYINSDMGFDWKTCAVICSIDQQSPDIKMGVDKGNKIGAGDQGLMFGYACDQTKEFMPLPISLAHKLTRRLSEVRKDGTLSFLRPDGKSQVTVLFDDYMKPIYVSDVVIATQHDPECQKYLRESIMEEVIKKVIPSSLIVSKTRFFINNTGSFVIGGPMADCGLTGRKIIVDTYGGWVQHGGGAFSGKDPSKVDRSASYMARYVAKNIVASGVCNECLVQVSYCIGEEEPIAVNFDFNRSLKRPLDINRVLSTSDFSPKGMIEKLDLLKPVYKKTASYGHFGREEFTWEQTNDLSYKFGG